MDGLTTDQLLDPPGVSERLLIPVQTLAVWRSRGEGPRYMKIGKHVRYSVAELDAWLSERTVTPSSGRAA